VDNRSIPIAIRILAYLAENPDAEDTLEGITEWWLLQQNLMIELKRVRTALGELKSKDLITEVTGLDERIYYRVNNGKYEEIQKVLKDLTF
jgi:hypothetical protein